MSDSQVASPAVCRLPSSSPSWTAVTGRQKLKWTLLSQAVMKASAIDRLASAYRRELSEMLRCFASESARRTRWYCARKFSEKKYAWAV